MTDQLVIRLEGGFAVFRADGTEISGLSRRGQGLLAYLSQQPGMRAERGQLADLLWSDRGEQQARASLRQEISLLRKVLPKDSVGASRQHVWLEPGQVTIQAGAEAEFMQGFDLPSEGFEDWLREARAGVAQPPDADLAASARPIYSRPAVVLFAFEAISTGEQDQMVASGIADDLRTTLSYWRWFPVIGPDAIGWRTSKDADLRAIAAEVQAAYAITGTLRCLGNRIKITVGLTDAATGCSKWTNAFEGTLDDIFQFQEDVSRMIVAQLEPQIAYAEASRIARAHPSSLAPWQLVTQADEIERNAGEGYGSREANFEIARLMEKSLEQDPGFAKGLARLGRFHFRIGLLGWQDDRAAAFNTSLDYSRRALAIDPDNWEAHAYYGIARIFGFQDYAEGQQHSEEAVRLNPSAVAAHHGIACAVEWSGEFEKSLDHLKIALRLNPNYRARAAVLGQITTCEMLLGNRDAAVDAAKRLLAIAPGYARGLQRCVATFGFFNETELATRSLEALLRLQPDFDEAYVRETYPYERAEVMAAFLSGFQMAQAFAR